MHIWDLRTCTYAICGLAHTRFAEVQLFPRGCHVATMWRTRCNHVETIALPQIAYVQVHKSQICICARPQIVYVQVRKSQMCMCARPQIAHVQVRKSQMCMCARLQIEYVQVRKSQMCMCARLQIKYVQVRKSQMCMCARQQITYVHVMTAATYRATVGNPSITLQAMKECIQGTNKEGHNLLNPRMPNDTKMPTDTLWTSLLP